MPDFGFLQGARDKDKLHRAIDALPDGACAILLSDSCFHDFDSDDAHTPESCALPVGNVADWRFIGKITARSGVGLLEFAKMAIFTSSWEDREDEG